MGKLIWASFGPFYIKLLGVKVSPISTDILKFEKKSVLITNKQLKKTTTLNNCCKTLYADEQYSRFLNY